MSVYKEAWFLIRDIEKQSKQIYPDAADFGALINKGDSLWINTKHISESFAIPDSRKTYIYETGKTASVVIEIADEGAKTWHKFKLEYVTSDDMKRKLKFDGYLTVEKIK